MQKLKICILSLLTAFMASEVSYAASFNFNGSSNKKKEAPKQQEAQVVKQPVSRVRPKPAAPSVELTKQERSQLSQVYTKKIEADQSEVQAGGGSSSGESILTSNYQLVLPENPNNDISRNPNRDLVGNPNLDIPRTPSVIASAPRNPNADAIPRNPNADAIPRNPNADAIPRNPNADAIPRNPNARD